MVGGKKLEGCCPMAGTAGLLCFESHLFHGAEGALCMDISNSDLAAIAAPVQRGEWLTWKAAPQPCRPAAPQPPRLTFLDMAKTGMISGSLGLLELWVLLFQTGAGLGLCAG